MSIRETTFRETSFRKKPSGKVTIRETTVNQWRFLVNRLVHAKTSYLYLLLFSMYMFVSTTVSVVNKDEYLVIFVRMPQKNNYSVAAAGRSNKQTNFTVLRWGLRWGQYCRIETGKNPHCKLSSSNICSVRLWSSLVDSHLYWRVFTARRAPRVSLHGRTRTRLCQTSWNARRDDFELEVPVGRQIWTLTTAVPMLAVSAAGWANT